MDYAKIITKIDKSNNFLNISNEIVLGNYNLGNDHEMIVLKDRLQKMPSANILWFYNNQITDDLIILVVEQLYMYTNLTKIYLSNNKIGNKGAEIIANMLATTNHIDLLDLSHNNIGDDGAKLLCEGLKQNTGLITIYLSHNKLNKNGFIYILNMLKTNISIKTAYISTYCLIETYDHSSTNICDSICELLKYNRNLNALSVCGIYVDKDIINNALQLNGSITELNLNLHDRNSKIIDICSRNRHNLKLKAKRLVDL